MKGEAVVSITPRNPFFPLHSTSFYDGPSVTKIFKVDGKGAVEFDVENAIKPVFDRYHQNLPYEIRATIIEELTGKNCRN